MDLLNTTLAGLVAIGAVNVVSMWKPDMDSRLKFAISFLVAFLVLFVPADLGNMILDKAKEAIIIALSASGVYKLTQKIGGV